MTRNPIPWANRAKCVARDAFDMNAGSLIHIAHPNDAHRRVAAQSMLKYVPEVGIPPGKGRKNFNRIFNEAIQATE